MQRSQEQEQGLGVYIADGIAITLCKELKGIILVCRFLGFYVRVSGPPPVCNRGPNCCQWRLSASVCLSLGGLRFQCLGIYKYLAFPVIFLSVVGCLEVRPFDLQPFFREFGTCPIEFLGRNVDV